MVPVIVAVVMTLRGMTVAVIVLLAHGSGLLLGVQVKGDHLLHALLGAAMGPEPLGGLDPI